MKGQVFEALPDLKFRVRLEDGREIGCYVSGRMKLHKIRVLVGDYVEVTLDGNGGAFTNRITKRL